MSTYLAKIRCDMGDECVTDYMIIRAEDCVSAMAYIQRLYGEDALSVKISFVDNGIVSISQDEYERIKNEYGAE